MRGITRILAPALLEDRAQRVERGPVDAELTRELRERRLRGVAGAKAAIPADRRAPKVDELPGVREQHDR